MLAAKRRDEHKGHQQITSNIQALELTIASGDFRICFRCVPKLGVDGIQGLVTAYSLNVVPGLPGNLLKRGILANLRSTKPRR